MEKYTDMTDDELLTKTTPKIKKRYCQTPTEFVTRIIRQGIAATI